MSGEGLTTDFPLVEQGYDPNQVDEYLATGMLQLREELDAARTRISELESELALADEAEEGPFRHGEVKTVDRDLGSKRLVEATDCDGVPVGRRAVEQRWRRRKVGHVPIKVA